ncbi:ribosomal RNA-processing protein 9 [[Candida] anglica]|uniref:Ribosomal RNA-processing protein 9 n=1 Tax=[Candida] anglica TaxID=148631 RepID=A0ABP0EGU9_9ASCO
MAGDPFLSDPSKKRKRGGARNSRPVTKQSKSRTQTPTVEDEEISGVSESDDEQGNISVGSETEEHNESALSSDEEFADENAADKRRRLAKQYLDNLKQNELGGDFNDFDAQDLDDDILSRRLQVDVAESKGFVYKFVGEKVEESLDGQKEEDNMVSVTRIGSKNMTGMALRAPYLYTISKDIELIKWKVNETGKGKQQRLKHTRGGSNREDHHIAPILCVAASPDGKYVVTGGADGRLIIWSSENLTCLKMLEVCRVGGINQVSFRRGTDQLYAACGDLRVRTFSINQFAQLEVLYGHQDSITDVASLSRETCVSVGARDKTAMFWKVAEESRLTFRGGDADRKVRKKKKVEGEEEVTEPEAPFVNEGSIDVVTMVDETHFVTGSDNGNLALWSLAKKKPLYTHRLGHGLEAALSSNSASAEVNLETAKAQVPDAHPYSITSVHAVPFSDVFVTGSYDGTLRVWKISSEGLRSFSLIGKVENVKGCVVSIVDWEVSAHKITFYALTSKEHKLGRWLGKIDGARNALVSFSVDI